MTRTPETADPVGTSASTGASTPSGTPALAPASAPEPAADRLRRWRLVLGDGGADGTGCELSGTDAAMDR
ncbi:hypothetical protein AN218_11575, partial [Streptomyces nanshensis]